MHNGLCILCDYRNHAGLCMLNYKTCNAYNETGLNEGWEECDVEIKVGLMMSGLRISETNEILAALSVFGGDTDSAINFCNQEIKRYTTSNFGQAWLYEEMKRIATECGTCEKFSKYGECNRAGCELSKGSYAGMKTTAQTVAEELGIAYLAV